MDDEAAASAARRENSAGRVPIVLTLADADVVAGADKPPPFYVNAPRLACLPSLVDDALEFYRDCLPPGEDAPWFDCGGVPLRNHVPIGVLADLAAAPLSTPWPITIHFRAFPADALVRWPGPHPARSAFLNDVKEAAAAASGSAAGVLAAPLADRDALWEAGRAGDAAAAWAASTAILGGAADGKDSGTAAAVAATIPLRLFVAFGGGRPPAYASRPAPARGGKTLGALLLECLPPPPPPPAASDDGDTASSSSSSPWSLTADGAGLALRGAPVAAVLACGVPAPLAAPAAWAAAALAACDRFLYIVVRVA